ncbi:MAG: TauD/TfdA family dioxygenase [Proteobacteria bacterium]|nr:TauD/TfdA family dioxygenase [Pseudomonadota bacterium]
MTIDIRPIAGALGAEIHGIDLARNLNADTVAVMRRALLDHLVIFFRDQDITPAQHLEFAHWFGTPVEYPFVRGLPDYPLITPILKLEHERVNFGGVWHADTTYQERPPMGTILVARELPPFGGDTLFANQYLAFETLSPALQRMLEGLRSISSSNRADVSRTREDRVRDAGTAQAKQVMTAEHPVVRRHPETGRRSLFISTAHTERFAGMTVEESAGLLQFLFRHQVRPEFTCRFRWQPGSIAFWDNRCTLHNPINDYHGYRRLLHRITLEGDRPT